MSFEGVGLDQFFFEQHMPSARCAAEAKNDPLLPRVSVDLAPAKLLVKTV